MKNNAVNWFEIFVANISQAQAFYETILDEKMTLAEMEGCNMAIFPFVENSGVGGALTQMEGFKPGAGGTLVYLNVEGKLDAVLDRVPAAGGKVVRGRTDIAPHGFIGLFEDKEGNIVGLHSMS